MYDVESEHSLAGMLPYRIWKQKYNNDAGFTQSFHKRTGDIGGKHSVALNGKPKVWEGRQVSRFGNPKKGSKFKCNWEGQPGFLQTKTEPNHEQQ